MVLYQAARLTFAFRLEWMASRASIVLKERVFGPIRTTEPIYSAKPSSERGEILRRQGRIVIACSNVDLPYLS